MLVRITNMENPDQTASYESARSVSALDVYAFLAGTSRVVMVFEILENLPYINEPRHVISNNVVF